MDWARAIEINHAALTRIVLGLIAMLGLVEGGAAVSLPRPLYLAVARVLRPAESAVRRLIVIAARGLKVNISPPRPMPKGLALAGQGGGGRNAFPLFDAPKRYDSARQMRVLTKLQPRIRVIDFIPVFQPQHFVGPAAVPEPDDSVDALRLGRRLAAVKMALENLPRQVARLARWQARRDRMRHAKFKSPLRPGRPPGHRQDPKDEIDRVLRECHALARDALKENTS